MYCIIYMYVQYIYIIHKFIVDIHGKVFLSLFGYLQNKSRERDRHEIPMRRKLNREKNRQTDRQLDSFRQIDRKRGKKRARNKNEGEINRINDQIT